MLWLTQLIYLVVCAPSYMILYVATMILEAPSHPNKYLIYAVNRGDVCISAADLAILDGTYQYFTTSTNPIGQYGSTRTTNIYTHLIIMQMVLHG